MNRRLRNAFVVTVAVTAGFLTTACEEGATGASAVAESDAGTPEAVASASPEKSQGSQKSQEKAADSGSGQAAGGADDTSADSSANSSSGSSEAGDKTGYGQSCGTNDLDWHGEEKTQAGGYYQISVKAKSGITCVLPGGLPVIAFGSGGTEAGPAEQSAGEEITLSGGKTVYAGVSPKSTSSDGGTEYTTVIVSVTGDDPNPISLKVGSVLVDKPVVTNWHTDPQAAVPFTS
ncbi:DUF4232 domain-containing protein [Streptomyces sp. NPDC002908]|uniref:DUF4232 domain-containing protein n=1 Tax=Streptomyces sp. NPDC002908 TaxID=3364670 RepID=UPI0036B5CE6E